MSTYVCLFENLSDAMKVNETKVCSSQLRLRFKQSQWSPKNVFGASTRFDPMASALRPIQTVNVLR